MRFNGKRASEYSTMEIECMLYLADPRNGSLDDRLTKAQADELRKVLKFRKERK